MSDHLTQYGLTDEAAHADLFDIGNYIAGLSSFITSSKTPMTISIQGSWGSGKTSMMQMVRARLGDDIHTIWFNTWQFAQFDLGDSLPFSMMSVLLKQLNAQLFTKIPIKGFRLTIQIFRVWLRQKPS